MGKKEKRRKRMVEDERKRAGKSGKDCQGRTKEKGQERRERRKKIK